MKDTIRRAVDTSGSTRGQLETVIDMWILSDRDRYILKRYLADGASYAQIADEMGDAYLTESAIGKRCRRAFSKIATKLQ